MCCYALKLMRSNASPPMAPKANPSWRIGIVHSSFYEDEVGKMVAGARKTLEEAGVEPKNISEHAAAGSFEIPLIGSALAKAKKVDALLGIGIIVEGETHHAELLARESARGIMDVQLQEGIPFAFEILYVKSLKDAVVRSSGALNKGAEAARAVLQSLAELKRLRS